MTSLSALGNWVEWRNTTSCGEPGVAAYLQLGLSATVNRTIRE